jgi:chlorophyll/bacteriochlorophyll a synthase
MLMQQPLISTTPTLQPPKAPALARSLALMKPVTWFGPMWALLCGAIASGATGWNLPDLARIGLGLILAGPVLCGVSQVINDYFDREVDALNEPHRLIPSGQVSIRQVFLTIGVLLLCGVTIGLYLGRPVALLVGAGLICAVAYSAPPLRAKRNGWIGNSLVALSYEGLAWLAGHLAFAPLTGGSLLLAALFSLGAHGIMSINDFKSIQGDRISGIRSIPVLYGIERAAWLIVLTMNLAQVGVLLAFIAWQQWWIVGVLAALLLIQLPFQASFLRAPLERHLKFSAFGVSFFVWAMMAAAIGVRGF